MGHISSSALFFASLLLPIWEVYCSYDDEKCIPSTQTVERVKICPQTLFSWKDREKKKNCFSVVHNCSAPLVYHCVINPWQNKTIEVCAPRTQINQGFCAEYNEGGARIQDSYHCNTCMTKYWSTEAYKYKECYDPVYSYTNMKTTYKVDQDTNPPATLTQQRKTTLQHHVINCAGLQKMNNRVMICLTVIVISNMMDKTS